MNEVTTKNPRRELPIRINVSLNEKGVVVCAPDPTVVLPDETVVWNMAPGLKNVSAFFEDRPFRAPNSFLSGVTATVLGKESVKKGERFKTHFRNNDNGQEMETLGDIIIGG